MQINRIFFSVLFLCTIILGTSVGQVVMQPGMRVALKADNGVYLGRCEGCVKFSNTRDFAFVHTASVSPATPWAMWDVVDAGQGKLSFKASDSGGFLSRCFLCGTSNIPSFDSVSVQPLVTPGNPSVSWTPEYQNGKVMLLADTGNYLTRCTNCFRFGSSSESAWVHNRNKSDSRAQWTVEVIQKSTTSPVVNNNLNNRINNLIDNVINNKVNNNNININNNNQQKTLVQQKLPVAEQPLQVSNNINNNNLNNLMQPGMRVALKADNGMYLGRCEECVNFSNTRDFAFIQTASVSPATPWAMWDVVDAGQGKLSFKASDSGGFLSRCFLCGTSNIPSFDSVSVQPLVTPGNPSVSWTPEYQNGKVMLLADTGNYLTRCTNCFRFGSSSESAWVHNRNKSDSRAQWTVEVIQKSTTSPVVNNNLNNRINNLIDNVINNKVNNNNSNNVNNNVNVNNNNNNVINNVINNNNKNNINNNINNNNINNNNINNINNNNIVNNNNNNNLSKDILDLNRDSLLVSNVVKNNNFNNNNVNNNNVNNNNLSKDILDLNRDSLLVSNVVKNNNVNNNNNNVNNNNKSPFDNVPESMRSLFMSSLLVSEAIK
jgi:ribosome-binding protein aMBF1 (putative translation factor)